MSVRVLLNPGMIGMVDAVFKNSSFRTKAALRQFIKRQRNPFKKYFRKYVITDDNMMIFLNRIYLDYLMGSEHKRKTFYVEIQRTGENDRSKKGSSRAL